MTTSTASLPRPATDRRGAQRRARAVDDDHAVRAAAAAGVPPACYRSEAFAEDLDDGLDAGQNAGRDAPGLAWASVPMLVCVLALTIGLFPY
jgi:hypothetical protein